MKSKFSTLTLIAILLLVSCGKGKSKFSLLPFALTGQSTISSHDSNSGVTQASPGADGSPATPTGTMPNNDSEESSPSPAVTGTGSPYEVIGGYFGISNPPLQVSSNASLLRVKLFDAPPVIPVNNGLVHFVTEFDFIESFFVNSDSSSREIPPSDFIDLTVLKIQVKNSKGEVITKIPSHNESSIKIKNGKHFVPFVRSLVLVPDTYSELKITLSPQGKLIYKENSFPLNLEVSELSFSSVFTVEAGKITTLHTKTYKESHDALIGNQREFTRQNFEENLHPDFVFKVQSKTYSMKPEIVSVGAEVHFPPTKLYVFVANLAAQDSNNSAYILNEIPTSFELLSLRNGFVGLAGSSEVEPKAYKFIQLQLGRLHSIEVNGAIIPIRMEERSQSIFRFLGTFQAQSGNVFETYLHLDPEKSIFYLKDKGFQFDPYIEFLSELNCAPEVESKISNSLGKNMNLVTSESELIVQGSIGSVTSAIAPNAMNLNIIYSDVTLSIDKVLKGYLQDSQLILKVPGGEVNGIKLEVTSMPKFTAGEKVVLFLKKYNNRWGIVRGQQGKVNL
ncbi:MAG: hypothetical protein SFU98_10885 [Leptospiraceae bacterium]|nr:hypothetical protein [Leptospiraceae bacterium]